MEIKDIIGFEGIYKISSCGKVFKCPCKRKFNDGKIVDVPERKLIISNRVGYPTVALYKNGKQHTFLMHRLMAIHFIENDSPLIKNEVNHKNKNIFDYSIGNLEWCTRSENMKHAKKRKL